MRGIPRLISVGSAGNADADGMAGLRATIANQNATIQELERRLMQSSAELSERDARIAALTRRNVELAAVAKECGAVIPAEPAVRRRESPVRKEFGQVAADPPVRRRGSPATQDTDVAAPVPVRPPVPKAKRRSSPGPAPTEGADVVAVVPERTSDRQRQHRESTSAWGIFQEKAPRDPNDGDDDIDVAIKRYIQDRSDEGIEFQKIRKGWYLVKPINKKVFLKHAGKDKLVVRVGGGHVSMQKFLDDFVTMAATNAHEASVAANNAKRPEPRPSEMAS